MRFALALDVLTHPGPADPARVDDAACSGATYNGFDVVRGIRMAAPSFFDTGSWRLGRRRRGATARSIRPGGLTLGVVSSVTPVAAGSPPSTANLVTHRDPPTPLHEVSMSDRLAPSIADDEFDALVAIALIARPLPGPRARAARYLGDVFGVDRLAAAQDVLLGRAVAAPGDHHIAFAVELLEDALDHARRTASAVHAA